LLGIWSSRSATSTSGYTRSRGARDLTEGLDENDGSAAANGCCWTALGAGFAAGSSSSVLDLCVQHAN
jgi:hypothetical protein